MILSFSWNKLSLFPIKNLKTFLPLFHHESLYINTQVLLVLLLGQKLYLKLLHGRGTGHDQLSGGEGHVITIHLKK